MIQYNFTTSTKVYFGAGKLALLHTLPLPGKKALVTISNGRSTRANGSLDKVLFELNHAGVAYVVYDGIGPNPTKQAVENGAAIANSQGCDFVVALGGGSVLDAAKIIAMNATNRGDLWNYVMSGTGGRQTPSTKPLPWIAIPTTSGTGSEVDAAGVISNLQTHEKLGIFGDFAAIAIVDPQLTCTVPPVFTAYQGFDALFHSLEGHICKTRNPFSDIIQEAAITRVARYLPLAIANGQNMEARENMAFASMLSGYSMVSSTCTVEHSIEHALSAYHPALPHGAGLIMLSKAYFSTIIAQGVANERLVEMARWLGDAHASQAQDFIPALLKLQQTCGVDQLKMSDYGIRPEEFDDMAENALTVMERLSTQDIQPLSHAEIVNILKQSYS